MRHMFLRTHIAAQIYRAAYNYQFTFRIDHACKNKENTNLLNVINVINTLHIQFKNYAPIPLLLQRMMTIESIEVLNGPSVWSDTRHKLIQMRLNLHELEQCPTNTIPGFFERLNKLIPTLYSHRCSPGVAGGFFERVKEGTWMGHVVEHIALEIQTLAGFDTGFGRTRETETPGTYNVVFSFINEDIGIYAATAAINIAEALVRSDRYEIEKDLDQMRIIGRCDVSKSSKISANNVDLI
ncbi:MAG: cyanophycin synthetase [Mucilaginibacter sp.]|nr:cyanophycin synthetase [Mucilaginibacter sp.]